MLKLVVSVMVATLALPLLQASGETGFATVVCEKLSDAEDFVKLIFDGKEGEEAVRLIKRNASTCRDGRVVSIIPGSGTFMFQRKNGKSIKYSILKAVDAEGREVYAIIPSSQGRTI